MATNANELAALAGDNLDEVVKLDMEMAILMRDDEAAAELVCADIDCARGSKIEPLLGPRRLVGRLHVDQSRLFGRPSARNRAWRRYG